MVSSTSLRRRRTMSTKDRTEAERLVAEQAVAAYREVLKAMEAAPHGQGFAFTETAVLAEGRSLMQSMMEQAMSAHPEAQKGGPAAGGVGAEEVPPSSTTRAKSS
jgi:hypothetical protein